MDWEEEVDEDTVLEGRGGADCGCDMMTPYDGAAVVVDGVAVGADAETAAGADRPSVELATGWLWDTVVAVWLPWLPVVKRESGISVAAHRP